MARSPQADGCAPSQMAAVMHGSAKQQGGNQRRLQPPAALLPIAQTITAASVAVKQHLRQTRALLAPSGNPCQGWMVRPFCLQQYRRLETKEDSSTVQSRLPMS